MEIDQPAHRSESDNRRGGRGGREGRGGRGGRGNGRGGRGGNSRGRGGQGSVNLSDAKAFPTLGA